MFQLYNSLILPYLNYGLLLWGNANKYLMTKILRLQKRALRTISNSPYLYPSKPLFEKYNVLNIFQMYSYELAIFMYKFKHEMLPPSFNGIFASHHETHNYNTRNKNDFLIPMQKVKTVLTTGPKVWNDLPNDIKIIKTLGKFKNELKSSLSSDK